MNNRENIWDVKLIDTHFVRERESRYGKWKNQMEKNDIGDQILGMDIEKMEQQPQ